MASEKKAYEHLERIAIGQDEPDSSHNDKYDFVISATMINNDGWDADIFHQMLRYVKMGGYIIFTTKLNLMNEDYYGDDTEKLADEQYWKFITEHTFYRYDKMCNGQGKFSNKMIKILVYQKTDHNEYLVREKDRLEYEAMIEK